MKKVLAVVFAIFASCTVAHAQQYKLVSYLDINVDSNGNLPRNPYVVDLENKGKTLRLIGTQHNRDTLSPAFTAIEDAFQSMRPQVLIHEGPPLHKTYTSGNAAILADGELGLDKFLADQAGIKTISGDEPDKQEFDELAPAFSRDEALIFFASERFIFPFVFGQYKGTLQDEYATDFIRDYMLRKGIGLSKEQQKLSYYTSAYKRFFHRDFDLHTIDQRNFTPFGRGNHFNDVTRKSKELRDRYLIRQIEAQLKLHERVLVVYGGWHVLAIEPALKQIIGLP